MASFDPKVQRLSAALGAEIRGVDLTRIDAPQARVLEELLWEHKVVFYPDQTLTLDQHVAFGEHFGQLEGHPHLKNPTTDHPKVFELAASHGGVADEWHTDLTFRPDPALYSILHMIRCPDVGGDTMWANTARAYEELSPPLKDLCQGLTAIHNAEPHGRPEVMTRHPVVRVHPETGSKALYVNEHFTRRIVELSRAESDLLLGYLTRWVASPRFTVRYAWQQKTVAIWDNRCTQHSVLNDFEGERVIQRVTVMGDAPKGSPPRWDPYTRVSGRSDTIRHDRLLRKYLREQEESER
jgi:taurine dioxygenase